MDCLPTRSTSRLTAPTCPIPAATGDTPVNPNSDMIAEFKVPDVQLQRREPEGTGGGQFRGEIRRQDFHGSAFFYARDAALNANDAFFNANSEPKPGKSIFIPASPSAARS